MTTRTFEISALSPLIRYDPPQDVPSSVWKSDMGGMDNSNANTGSPSRVLQGTGTVTIQGFGTGLGLEGSLAGVYCNYTATLNPGKGNNSPTSALPPAQTGSPATGFLASFTGLENNNWELTLKGDCTNGSQVKIFKGVVEGWVGVEGGTVSNRTLDDSDSQLAYTGVDWSKTRGLSAPFYGDSQTYTSVGGAKMNLTFSGSAIILWASVDGQHGSYSASLRRTSDSYREEDTQIISGYSPFLAVPIPHFFATGLDPNEQYTLVYENRGTSGTYIDLDYVEIYTSTGGGPPNGGSNLVVVPPAKKANNLPAIIGGAVGGAVFILLLLLLLLFLRKRRRVKVGRRRGVRPIDDAKRSSTGHTIPLHMHGQVTPSPYRTHQDAQRVYESQALLQQPYSVAPTTSSYTPTTQTLSPTSQSFDPYAAFGGGYPIPHGVAGIPPISDHVQIRRESKAAEIEAARERARASHNNSSVMIVSNPQDTDTQASTTLATSWDASSSIQAKSTVGLPPQPIAFKAPDEPPPSYDQS
ncbi:hypothetical protein FRC16_005391 [Serendipita sp. 398]|nr:hypothetical protein FRC16_005391 [Serendipita sp. 398]